jgi:glycosyltransferase involved in cell wall biosynthesis
MKCKKVSVIIPLYNGSRFLKETLDSLFAQRNVALEVIIIDDGSAQNVDHILKPYQERLIYIKQEHAGVDSARNRGVSVATGDYITFIDQDDIWLPDALAVQCSFFNDDPKIGMVVSDGYEFDEEPCASENGAPLLPRDIRAFLVEKGGRYEEKDIFKRFLYGLITTPSQVLFARHVFEKIGSFDLHSDTMNDFEFYLRLARGYRVIFHSAWLVRKRYHATSASGPRHLRAILYALNNMKILTRLSLKIELNSKKDTSAIREAKKYYIAYILKEALYRLYKDSDSLKDIVRLLKDAQIGAWQMRSMCLFFSCCFPFQRFTHTLRRVRSLIVVTLFTLLLL